MKGISIILIMICSLANGQESRFDPKIIIFTPDNVEISNDIQEKINVIETRIFHINNQKISENYDSLLRKIINNDSISKNFQSYYINQIEVSKNLDFKKYIAKNIASSLQIAISTDFPNVLVELKPNIISRELIFLDSLSRSQSADYLLFIDLLKVRKNKEDIIVIPSFKLYIHAERKIINISNSEVDRYNILTLEYGNKLTKILLDDILSTSNIRNLIIEKGDYSTRVISGKRNEYLLKQFEAGRNNNTVISLTTKILPDIDPISYYTSLSNLDNSQIISFYIGDTLLRTETQEKPMYSLNLIYYKKNNNKWEYKYLMHNAYSSKNITREERIKKMYFNVENIFFFTEGTSQLNDEFWKKELFIKYAVRFGL